MAPWKDSSLPEGGVLDDATVQIYDFLAIPADLHLRCHPDHRDHQHCPDSDPSTPLENPTAPPVLPLRIFFDLLENHVLDHCVHGGVRKLAYLSIGVCTNDQACNRTCPGLNSHRAVPENQNWSLTCEEPHGNSQVQ